MKKRTLFYTLKKHILGKEALVITGMRQVGKTTLLRQIYEELDSKVSRLWFDFDNPLEMRMFEDNDYRVIYERLQNMVEGGKKERLYIFIDEIQNFPAITKVIKYLIDHYQTKFFLTGSSNFYLKNLFPESLSGRKFLYDLPPLSFKEILYFKDKISLDDMLVEKKILPTIRSIDQFVFKKFETEYNNYLQYGGFPAVVTADELSLKTEILTNIFKSFFEKDIKILSDYKDVKDLRDLLLLLVPRVGSMLDINKLSSEMGINRVKLYGLLEFLQGAFMIRLLPKFSRSVDKSVAGGKKVYFSDTGLLNIIGKINDSQLLENSLINQLAEYGHLSFYNYRNTAEIDVILNKEIAFEIKTKGIDSDYTKLKGLSEGLKLKKYFVISKILTEKSGFISALQI